MSRPNARASASALRLLVQRRVLTCIPLCGPLLSEMRSAHVRQRHLLDLQAHYIAWEGKRFVQGSKNRRIARSEGTKSARGIARAGCARSAPSRALRRRPQSEFLKRCGDCLSDWALPKSLGRAEGGPERRQSGQTLWHLQPDPFPNLRNCYHRPCSHYPQGRTQHAHT